MTPSHPTGLDQSWGFANPAEAKAKGIQVVSMYLSHDLSKNVTASDVKAYHADGIGVLLNWEGQSGAPLLGAGQGGADATAAVGQARALVKAVGHPVNNRLSIVFSCDRDTNSGEYSKIDAYYAATQKIVHAAGFLNGAYGEYDLGNHLVAKKLIDVFWQTYAWSGGRLSPSADFYQYLNGQTLGGASVDFDQVIHPTKLGVYWPPNHPLNIGADDMTPADLAAINSHTDAVAKAQTKAITTHIDSMISKVVHGAPTLPDSEDSIMATLKEIKAAVIK